MRLLGLCSFHLNFEMCVPSTAVPIMSNHFEKQIALITLNNFD